MELNELEKNIMSVLREKLPQVQIELLQQRMSEGEMAIKRVIEQQKLIDNLLKEKEELSKENIKLKDENAEHVKRENEIEKIKRDCEEKKRGWENERLKILLSAQSEMNTTFGSVLETVFSSPVYRERIDGQMAVDRNGCMRSLPFSQMVTNEIGKAHIHHMRTGDPMTSTDIEK